MGNVTFEIAAFSKVTLEVKKQWINTFKVLVKVSSLKLYIKLSIKYEIMTNFVHAV